MFNNLFQNQNIWQELTALIVDTYITSEGCDIRGIYRLHRTDKLNKQSTACSCDGNLKTIIPYIMVKLDQNQIGSKKHTKINIRSPPSIYSNQVSTIHISIYSNQISAHLFIAIRFPYIYFQLPCWIEKGKPWQGNLQCITNLQGSLESQHVYN